MAITGAIPLPGNGMQGFNQGLTGMNSLFSQLIAQQATKEQMDRLRQMLPLEKQMKQAQISHMGAADAMLPLQRMLYMEQLKKAQMENDPTAQLEYLKKIQEGLGNGSPQGDASNANAILAGFLKHKFGIDMTKETPEQKESRAVDQAVSIDEAKTNRKKLDDIEATARALIPYAQANQRLEEILTRKPELPGRLTGLADQIGLTKDEDVGAFISGTQKLQSKMAKELSSRGGYGVSRLVEQAKPNIAKSSAYNKGVIKELKQEMKSSFDEMKSEYERLAKKPFPYSYDEYFKDALLPQAQAAQGNTSAQKKVMRFNPATGRLE